MHTEQQQIGFPARVRCMPPIQSQIQHLPDDTSSISAGGSSDSALQAALTDGERETAVPTATTMSKLGVRLLDRIAFEEDSPRGMENDSKPSISVPEQKGI